MVATTHWAISLYSAAGTQNSTHTVFGNGNSAPYKNHQHPFMGSLSLSLSLSPALVSPRTYSGTQTGIFRECRVVCAVRVLQSWSHFHWVNCTLVPVCCKSGEIFCFHYWTFFSTHFSWSANTVIGKVPLSHLFSPAHPSNSIKSSRFCQSFRLQLCSAIFHTHQGSAFYHQILDPIVCA